MRALLYVTRHTFVNKLRKALKRPVTYIYIIMGVFYGIFLLKAIAEFFIRVRLNSAIGMTAVMMVLTIFIYGTDFVSHAKRKGVFFKQSHAHLIFTSPVNPKLILLYAAAKNFIMTIILALLVCIGGMTVFGLSALQGLLLFFLSCICTLAFEGSQIILLYANERFSEKTIRILSKTIYGVLLLLILFCVWYFKTNGLSADTLKSLIESPLLRLIPILGWNIAAYHLVLIGPSVLNIVCTLLYLLSVGVSLMAAVRQRCVGEYFEDAAKFADDYADFRSRNKKGETTYWIGRQKQFKRVNSTYDAKGAAAIFYRQLLEYKKERFFIFGNMTWIGILIAAVVIKGIGKPAGIPGELFLLGVAAYMVLLTSGYLGKWEKELKNPYLFLIPDTPLRKMWYATLMEHIKAVADSLFFIVPIGIAWHISVWKIFFIWLIYVVLQANKLYLRVFSEAVLGDTLGKTGKNILRAFIQSGILGIGIVIAVVIYLTAGNLFLYPAVLIYSLLITGVIALLAAGRFERMEQSE